MLSHWSMCQAATLSTVQHKREILRGVAWDGPTVWSSQPKAEMRGWHKQSPEDVRSLAGPKHCRQTTAWIGPMENRSRVNVADALGQSSLV
jgi:hypothetical protein